MEGENRTEAEASPAKKKLGMEDFTIKYRLGKGAYGDVFLVIKHSDRKAYALKQIQKKKLEREQKEYQALVERELLTNFKHPGIVKLRYSFQDKTSLYFVQEYCQGGEFINFIKANINKLTEQVKVFYIGQIVNLIEYIHGHGVTHRDLKPENLMLDHSGHLKLIDFGTAEITQCTLLKPEFKEHITKLKKKAEDQKPAETDPSDEASEPGEMDSPLKKRRSTFVGTCYYISPELLEHNYCPHSADLWALGCIIYQLYYLETPFKDSYEFAVFEKIKKAEYSFPKLETITESAIDLIKKLLVKTPEERLGSGTNEELSFKQLKAHPYFKGLDIDNIFSLPVPYIPDLHATDQSEQDEKDREETYTTFKGQIEEILKTLSSEGKEVLKHEIVEEKVFVNFNYALLVLYKGGQVCVVGADDLEKKREVQPVKREEGVCKLLSESALLIYEEDRMTEFKTSQAEEWVSALNSQN